MHLTLEKYKVVHTGTFVGKGPGKTIQWKLWVYCCCGVKPAIKDYLRNAAVAYSPRRMIKNLENIEKWAT